MLTGFALKLGPSKQQARTTEVITRFPEGRTSLFTSPRSSSCEGCLEGRAGYGLRGWNTMFGASSFLLLSY